MIKIDPTGWTKEDESSMKDFAEMSDVYKKYLKRRMWDHVQELKTSTDEEDPVKIVRDKYSRIDELNELLTDLENYESTNKV